MINGLTSLRGIFILFIFFHHCLLIYPGGGSMAVAFFFVLGGFCLTLGYKDRCLMSDFSYRQYITRRCLKFYPLHWLCLLAVIPLTLKSFNNLQIPIIFANAALLQSWIPIKDVYFSFNAVSWYLSDTMFFALIFPVVFKQISKTNARGHILIATSLALIYVLVVVVIPQKFHHAILYISPIVRLTDFVFGIYLALLYLHLKEKPQKWWKGNLSSQVIVLTLILLLVFESCVFSDEIRVMAPVYWPMIGAVILMTALSSRVGGGQIFA